MHRVDMDGHQDNRFSNGDPSTGRQPTQLGTDWLNDVQENIAAAVEGAERLKKGDWLQLRRAIRQCGHQGIIVERDVTSATFRGNPDQKVYDEKYFTELSNGAAGGQSGIRVTSLGGKPSIQLWGEMGGGYVPLWRAGSDGSGSVSDERLKTRLGPVPSLQAINAIARMHAEWFVWRSTPEVNQDSKICGIVAQEIVGALRAAGLPEKPFMDEVEGFLMPNRDAIFSLLISAVGLLSREYLRLKSEKPSRPGAA